MPRNRLKTENRILDAAREILRRAGFSEWGVNAIAREAGVDKVLIYRYFDGLDGLLQSLVSRVLFWPDPDSLPRRSTEAWLEATRSHLSRHPEIPVLLSLPGARHPGSFIGRKFSSDLEGWLEGFASHLADRTDRDILEMLPALLLYEAATGRDNWSAADLSRQLLPSPGWQADPEGREEPEELPPELL